MTATIERPGQETAPGLSSRRVVGPGLQPTLDELSRPGRATGMAVGSALAAVGGVMVALAIPRIDPLMGLMTGLKAFVAAVLGGIGNIPGAMIGGVLIGLLEAWLGATAYSTYRDAAAFAVLILILLFRPAGIMGTATVEKV